MNSLNVATKSSPSFLEKFKTTRNQLGAIYKVKTSLNCVVLISDTVLVTQTKRFNQEAAKINLVSMLFTISTQQHVVKNKQIGCHR